jgi:hypothetical protein
MGSNRDTLLLHASESLHNYSMERGANDKEAQIASMRPQKASNNPMDPTRQQTSNNNRTRGNILLIEPAPAEDGSGPSHARFGQKRIKNGSSKLQAFVESASEDSDLDSDNSNISDWESLHNSDGGIYLGANEREIVSREAEKVTEAELKIQKPHETATSYRQKAEHARRKKMEEAKYAFMREQIRQAQISEEQKEAERRQRKRDEKRERRKAARRSHRGEKIVDQLRSYWDIDWFWISQMDIIPGYFATIWQGQYSPLPAIGAIAVALEALLGFTDKKSLQYSWTRKRSVWEWLQQGKSTFPPYARNSRGGVVVEGSYEPVTFEAFEQKLCPLQLLHCYDYQVDRHP